MKKLLSLLLVVAMLFTATACTSKDEDKDASVLYTYRSYSSALGTGWNPHTWETSAESTILSYITTPWVDASVLDSENSVYQWTFKAASEITDVTAAHKDLLTKYTVDLGGKTVEQVESGYVYEIKLNKDLKWETGEAITADDYVESLKRFLDPKMKNYRANTTYEGDTAIAGGSAYYYSDAEGMWVKLSSLGYSSVAEALAAGVDVKINVAEFWGVDKTYTDANGNVAPSYVSVTDTVVYGESVGDAFTGADIWAAYGAAYLEVGGDYDAYVVAWKVNENKGASFDVVGFVKVDDYTVLWVNEKPVEYNYFLYSQTSNFLVYIPTYDAGLDTTLDLKTTDYCTTAATTVSYGPYKMASYEADKQLVYEKNPYYYAYTKDESTGRYVGKTNWLVDGEVHEVYQADRIIVDVMSDDSAKQAFLKGELSEWSPSADDLKTYVMSDQLLKADESYTMTYFFNCGLENLKKMDESYGNTNSVVLSNKNFRKAFSLSIDRDEFVTATSGYKTTYGLINELYYYDVFNNPNSVYRYSEAAKQGICDLYGIEYGEGKAYATLDEAYKSVNGYNMTEAKELMKQAYDELTKAGLYKGGEDIVIRIGYAKGALDSSIQQQSALINKYINEAAEGSGFGKITLEPVGNIDNRYTATAKGEFAIGWGGWGGAAFDPFTKFQVFMDPEKYGDQVVEVGCYNPLVDKATLTIQGEKITMTWQEWSNSMASTGRWANADALVKLEVLAKLERAFIEQYFDIPVCSAASCSLSSYQVNMYTKKYNMFYGFGGTELMTFNYTDKEWASFVKEQGGTLSYE